MTFIRSDYPDYTKIATKARNLTDLVTNLKEVQLQDSLQMMAKMPEKELFKFVDKIIQRVKEAEAEAERLAKEAELLNMYDMGNRGRQYQPNQKTGGKWYFYNPSSLSFGQTEFMRKWGRRNLEDNWRRRNKSVVEITPENEFGEGEEEGDTTDQLTKND
jgi:hypothetical protein